MTGRAGVVIIGASLSGLTTAEGLRGAGFAGPITLVGSEDHLPYNRPSLSKQVLAGQWSTGETTIRDQAQLDALGVRLLLGKNATAVDLTARTVTVGRRSISFERLVVATGVSARRLPNTERMTGVHALRTVDDAIALREDLAGAGRVAVVGAGVLGCEIAASIRTAGYDVTLVGRSYQPRFGQTGDHLSAMIGMLLREHGIRMRSGVDVIEVSGHGSVSTLRLSDGSLVPADLVVSAIGCVPVVNWLSGAGIDLSDGVLCDAHGRAATGVYSVGDVARWFDPVAGVALRVEHQATAIEQAHAVARLIVTGEQSAPIVPFFWSELFGNRILVHGRLDPDAPLTVLAGDPADRCFVAATIRDGRTTGLIGWNMPREFRQERARVLEQQTESLELLKGSPVS